MLDIQKLEEVANEHHMEVTLIDDDRITIRCGVTEIDFFQLDAFDVTQRDELESMVSRDKADGWAWYREEGFAPCILVTQKRAEELAAGGGFPAPIVQQWDLSRKLEVLLAIYDRG